MFKRGFKAWCERTALDVRKRMDLQSVDPVDLNKLAATLGAKILFPNEIPGLGNGALKILTESDPDSWSALTIKSGEKALIILNPTHSPARQQSDLAHELSHLLIGHATAEASTSQDGHLLTTYDRQQEDEATWLAGCLLLPRTACVHVRRRRLDSWSVAQKYGVSQEMLRYRLQVTGAFRQFDGRAQNKRAAAF